MKRPHHTTSNFRAPLLSIRPATLTLLLGAALATSGCSRDSSDLQAYIDQVRARPAAPIDPIPQMRSFETFAYSEAELRDPFVVPKQETVRAVRSDGPRPDTARPRELLEDFPLDSLRMMGTLMQGNTLWALVRDRDGTVHRVRAGNFLGQNHGEIVGISENAIQVRELVRDGMGGWIRRDAALAMKN